MSIFVASEPRDINRGVLEYKDTPSALLLDVRTEEEYAGGHIPQSINLPAGDMRKVFRLVPDENTPLFVYCLSGGRSAYAAATLQSMGYLNVKDIGGISAYTGELER